MGLLVIGFILVPLFVLMIVAIVGSPEIAKVATMFTGVFFLQVIAIVISIAAFAAILSFIVPQ